MSIWITSDTHFNHNNIVNLENFNLRNTGLGKIETIEEYNEMVINRINSCVKTNDTLYILGDFCFGGCDAYKNFAKQINGRKIFIFGNHDKIQLKQACQLGFDEAYDSPVYLPNSRGSIILSHYPVIEANNNDYIYRNYHGHLHGSFLDNSKFFNVNIAMNRYLPIKIEDREINDSIFRTKSRKEGWLKEWYADQQVFWTKRDQT